jgi:hypothetical protein
MNVVSKTINLCSFPLSEEKKQTAFRSQKNQHLLPKNLDKNKRKGAKKIFFSYFRDIGFVLVQMSAKQARKEKKSHASKKKETLS